MPSRDRHYGGLDQFPITCLVFAPLDPLEGYALRVPPIVEEPKLNKYSPHAAFGALHAPWSSLQRNQGPGMALPTLAYSGHLKPKKLREQQPSKVDVVLGCALQVLARHDNSPTTNQSCWPNKDCICGLRAMGSRNVTAVFRGTSSPFPFAMLEVLMPSQ